MHYGSSHLKRCLQQKTIQIKETHISACFIGFNRQTCASNVSSEEYNINGLPNHQFSNIFSLEANQIMIAYDCLDLSN